MRKKTLLVFAAIVAIAVGVVGMSAYEAHIINVTAKIENALSVMQDHIDFGTVFPQEYLTEDVEIALSQSFLDEDNADDVEYVIKQKPKPRPESYEGADAPYPSHFAAHEYCLDNEPGDASDPDDEYYDICYPVLCSYLSKHDADLDDENDGPDTPAFHDIDTETLGRLAKSQQDVEDLWTIDLAVPCFDGQCAQDWDNYVTDINPDADPAEYVLPTTLEHEVFGCDLWIEVTGISRVVQPDTEGDTASIALDNKTGDFRLIDDAMKGVLVYNLAGPTFDFTLSVEGLQANTDYRLIYAPDPWPQGLPVGGPYTLDTVIKNFTTDTNGDFVGAGSKDLGYDLPHPDDSNTSAKVWVVPASDHDGFKMTAYNQALYLFEYDVISYDDTDV